MADELKPTEYSPWDEPKLDPASASLDLSEPPLDRIRRPLVIGIATTLGALLLCSAVYAISHRTQRVQAERELQPHTYGNATAQLPKGIQELEMATTPAAPIKPTDDGADVADTLPIQKPVPPIDYADQQASKYFDLAPEHTSTAPVYRASPDPAFAPPERRQEGDCCGNGDLPSMEWPAAKEGQGAVSGAPSQPSLALSGIGQQTAQLGAAQQQLGQLQKLLAAAQNGGESSGDADDRKEQFQNRQGIETLGSDEDDLAECDLSAGTPIHGSVLVATNSDVPSGNTVTIQVSKTVYCGADHQYVAIPQGSTFTGEVNSRVGYGDERAQLCMKQLQRPPSAGHPTGSRKKFGCMIVADIQGAAGMQADVDNHWGQLIAGSLLSAVLSIGATVPAGNQTGFAPTVAQNAARGAGTSINQAGQRIVNRELQRKPTLTTEMLENVNVMFTENMELEPWLPRRRR
jgi:type IV secretory pathway VirB10-like protein